MEPPEVELSRHAVPENRESIQRERTQQFLVAHSLLLLLALVLVGVGDLAGLMTDLVLYQSIAFTAVVGLVTGLGWRLYLRGQATTSLVVGMLYVDSVVALFFLYVAGEFEVGLGLLAFPIIMAPIYAHRRHSWGLAAFQILVYLGLMAARQYDLLPYGNMLPAEALKSPPFVTDSIIGFLIVTIGVAFLSGRVSIDILTSQRQLEQAVNRQTRRLSLANASLHAATRALEELNRELAHRNEELASTNSRLQESNQALGQFNAAVSHDLRVPLQRMRAAVDLLRLTEPELTERQEERIASIERAIAHMEGLIRELHRLSQVHHLADELVPVQLSEVVRDVQAELEPRIQERGAVLELVHPLPTVLGNPVLLREVVQNLLDNGLKYGDPEHPRVRIEPADAAPGYAAFAVEDNGEGIHPSEQHLVFRLFNRLERHRSEEGLGAGLAIVQRIVQAHGGSIHLERGQSLKGARFVVELRAPELPAELDDALSPELARH